MRYRNTPLNLVDPEELDWKKTNGLIPAIVQDECSGQVLMLGYMNEAALTATISTGFATFYSRSRQALWRKGESSGHVLRVLSIHSDCDNDTLLVLAQPQGPTCHLGGESCFGKTTFFGPAWLDDLSEIIRERAANGDETSYTRQLLSQGIERVAQKIGEEGVEVALAAVTRPPTELAEELADLLYHVAVLMEPKGVAWKDVISILRDRHAVSERESS